MRIRLKEESEKMLVVTGNRTQGHIVAALRAIEAFSIPLIQYIEDSGSADGCLVALAQW